MTRPTSGLTLSRERSGRARRRGENAGDVLPPYEPGKLSLSRTVPLGLIGLITPWNYPMNLAMRAVAPGLAFATRSCSNPPRRPGSCRG
ncbi:aldehyde dehydrogenase family protein [Kibdelosporangium phytohabitans]|uniref:aldehyde dehydrogenase family protein n=1 Tax=Kibdelosporangium phytohabitans TaxID=860235 RepID=UPI001C54C0F0